MAKNKKRVFILGFSAFVVLVVSFYLSRNMKIIRVSHSAEVVLPKSKEPGVSKGMLKWLTSKKDLKSASELNQWFFDRHYNYKGKTVLPHGSDKYWHLPLSDIEKKLQKHQVLYKSFETVLREEGCFPKTRFEDFRKVMEKSVWGSSNEKSLMLGINFIEFSHLLFNRSRLFLQKGLPNQAAAPLLLLLDKLSDYEQNCPRRVMMTLLSFQALKKRAWNVLSQIALHKALTISHMRRFAKHLVKAQSATFNPLPFVLQQEFILGQRLLKEASWNTGSWPQWSSLNTSIWHHKVMNAEIALAKGPYNKELHALSKPVKALNSVKYYSAVEKMFTYNHHGLRMVREGARLSRMAILGWHQNRCISAFTLHRLVDARKKLSLPVPAVFSEKDLLNPITGKAFKEWDGAACGLRAGENDAYFLKEKEFFPLLSDLRILSILKTAFAQSTSIELFSLEPVDIRNPRSKLIKKVAKGVFHNYYILGKASFASDDARKKLLSPFYQAVIDAHKKDSSPAKCFQPRHGLRIHHQGKKMDLVICFQCHRFLLFADFAKQRGFSIEHTFSQNFTKALTAQKIPVTKN